MDIPKLETTDTLIESVIASDLAQPEKSILVAQLTDNRLPQSLLQRVVETAIENPAKTEEIQRLARSIAAHKYDENCNQINTEA